MPQRLAGETMLPTVSLPMAKPTSPAAVAAPGPALLTGRAFFEEPGVRVSPAEPDVVERQRAQAQLGHQHCAGLLQPLHHRGVLAGTRFRNGSAP